MQERVRASGVLAIVSGLSLACGAEGHPDRASDSPGGASAAVELADPSPDPLWSGWQYPDCERLTATRK